MNSVPRWIAVAVGAAAIVVSIGLFLEQPWATWVWPLPSSHLSNIFLSSILAAIGAPVAWIGLSGDLRAAAGGALNLGVTNAGFAFSSFLLFSRKAGSPLLIFALLSVVMLLLCVVLFLWSERVLFQDSRPIPGVARASFLAFAITLLVAAVGLLLRRPNIFPWPISDENSILYGWIFLGAMFYFLYALAYPVVSNVRGQLLGFLAYDLVLIGPFLLHFRTVEASMLTSLIIYTAVLGYSGLLAAYLLLIHPPTRLRFGRTTQGPAGL
jgi:hypothetical protein